jgi:large subunit ribosomal protein L25
MAAEQINLSVESREANGSGQAGRLRASGKIPAVVYGGGAEAKHIQLEEHAFEMMLRHHTSEYLMMNLKVDGGAEKKVLLKDVQHHPITRKIQHVDFHEVRMDRRVRVRLNINFVGIPVGVTVGGGTLDYHLRDLKVECLPGDITETFEVDISHLDVGEHMIAGDIVLDDKFRCLTADEVSVVSIAKPRVSGKATDGDDEGEAEPAAE